MKRYFALVLVLLSFILIKCSSDSESSKKLNVENITDVNDSGNGGSNDNNGGNSEIEHSVFKYSLGASVESNSDAITIDPTGKNILTDYDGDGIPNDLEVTTNKFVADYPKIVTRISAPITMEVRVSSTSVSENHVETVEDNGVTNTIANSMEDRQYAQMNNKTTPYVTKESASDSESNSEAYGWSHTESKSSNSNFSLSGMGGGIGGGSGSSSSKTDSENYSIADSFSKSKMNEKTVFEDVDYMDNLDRNGIAFTDETVEKITKNSRKSEILKNTDKIGPNAGVVRASLFLKNESVNFPAHISNIKCTLTFRTPGGKFLPVKTFLLRDEDWSEFEQDIYGSEELGPYTVEITDLNTNEVKKALDNGYIPQIHVVSYNITRVKDTNYNPGIDNLKIVEENAKGRTALIKINAPNLRDSYRVCAFDVDSRGKLSPGISLKKALFNIFKSQVGSESWTCDNSKQKLTIADNGLYWKSNTVNKYEYTWSTENKDGNMWREFETYIKSYKDEFNRIRYIEAIKRIGAVKKYNPFNKADNPNYDPNELLSENEVNKMRYWYILHNGRYFDGDLNDPIWAGERYELICVDVKDFNKHFQSFNFTPLQSMSTINIDTRWNSLTDTGDFSRGVYLGKVYLGDVVEFVVDLKDSRFLFEPGKSYYNGENSQDWFANNFNYNIEDADSVDSLRNGVPSDFSYTVTGGVNNLEIDFKQADNTAYYEITLKYPNNLIKKIKVSDVALEETGNILTINRKTPDLENNEIGELVKGTYKVSVKAHGYLYGVPVSKTSSTGELETVVSDAYTFRMPGDFSFQTTGLKESVSVYITKGQNTEYYAIRVAGPYNCQYESGEVPVKEVIGSAGYNQISLDAPAEYKDKIESGEPAVYKVTVYPVNKFFLDDYLTNDKFQVFKDRESAILVTFDKYSAQKKYRPKKINTLSMYEAVNLEVNFNDGSGWYKVRLTDSDTTLKSIDCRYTKYLDYKNQKYYISFLPPSGKDTDHGDVFSGGRESVDIYVRTTPLAEYRDRFWQKDLSGYQVGFSFVDSFLNSWIFGTENIASNKAEYSDATYIDEVLESNTYNGFALPYTFSGNDIDNYFFSPYEYRLYGITATLKSELQPARERMVGAPAYTAEIGSNDREIVLTGIEGDYCDKYQVFYRQVQGTPTLDVLKKENVQLWNLAGTYSREELQSDNHVSINGLIANTDYVTAVIGVNAYGYYSEPVYSKENGALELLRPFNRQTPGKVTNVALNLKSDSKTIVVTNIFEENSTDYYVEWKTQKASVWTSGSIEAVPGKPVQYEIAGTANWEKYQVRVRGFNENASGIQNGEWSDNLFIETDSLNSFGTIAVAFVDGYYTKSTASNSPALYYVDLNLTCSSFPVGTTKVIYSVNVIRNQNKKIGGSGTNSEENTQEVDYYVTGAINVDSAKSIKIFNDNNFKYFKVDTGQGYQETVTRYYYGTTSVQIQIQCQNQYGDMLNSQTYLKTISEPSTDDWPKR